MFVWWIAIGGRKVVMWWNHPQKFAFSNSPDLKGKQAKNFLDCDMFDLSEKKNINFILLLCYFDHLFASFIHLLCLRIQIAFPCSVRKRFTEASRFASFQNYSLLANRRTRKTYASALGETSRMLLLKTISIKLLACFVVLVIIWWKKNSR